jgi:hypothetical protein
MQRSRCPAIRASLNKKLNSHIASSYRSPYAAKRNAGINSAGYARISLRLRAAVHPRDVVVGVNC